MSERKDITAFGESLLAGTRQRRDDQYTAYKQDRDKQARDARKREKRQLLYGYGAKAVLGIGNAMVKSSTENFLQKQEVLNNNIKFKSALSGATGRTNDRNLASVHEAGEDEFWRSKALATITPSFNAAIPDTYNAGQREKLLYNESLRAGAELKKLYKSSAEQDKMLLERVGKEGASAYTDALVAQRGDNIGTALLRKFKGVFKKDGDPLDNSVKANDLMKSSENVKAYGELRRMGLEPFLAQSKIQEWTDAGKKMSIATVSTEVITIKVPVDTGVIGEAPKTVDKSVIQRKDATGALSFFDIDSQIEVTQTDLTYTQQAAAYLKRNTDQVEQHKVNVAQYSTVEDVDVLGRYATILLNGSTDEDRSKATANDIYSKMLITQNTLQSMGNITGKQSEEIATKMHVLNASGMIDETGFGARIQGKHNLITGSAGYHPLLAYVAVTELEKNRTSSVGYNAKVKKAFMAEYANNIEAYDGPLSDEGRARITDLLKNNPEALASLNSILEPPKIPEPVVEKTSEAVVAAVPAAAAAGTVTPPLPLTYAQQKLLDSQNSVYDAATGDARRHIEKYNQLLNTIARQEGRASESMKAKRERSLLKIQGKIAEEMKRTSGYVPAGAGDIYTRYLERINATAGV